MKRTLFLIALSFACLTSSQADTVSIDFGSSTSPTDGSVNITEKNLKANPSATEKISLGSTMHGTVQLEIKGLTKYSDSTKKNSKYSGHLEGSVPSFTESNYDSSELDGLSFGGGNDDKGIYQKVPDLVITFANLAAGTYSMEILSGWSGTNPMHAGLSFTLGGVGITTDNTSWEAKQANNVILGSWTPMSNLPKGGTLKTELVAGTSTTSDPLKNKGVVANASDIIVQEGATLTLTISGNDNTTNWDKNCINNIKLTSKAIPEPTTATLSL
ncbi:MAG: hypothetical protein RR419_05240, partial [Akkermansia sp.]